MSRSRLIRYLSDLHLEFTGYEPQALPSVGEDIVVLAGDIGETLEGMRWAREAIPDRPVVYVLGNHEFYYRDFDELIGEARAYCAGSNVTLLERDEVTISGLRILGCSLWTNFGCFGDDQQERAMNDALVYMEDYTEIRSKGRGLIPKQTAERCALSRAWLEARLSASNEPTLVVTHHAPSLVTINPRFSGALSNAAFHNSFDDLVRPPCVAWIHGHTHFTTAQALNGIPLITNQRGYPDEVPGDFSWTKSIRIAVSDGGA